MKQLIFTLIFFLKFTLNTASAHQDFYVTKDYGNIKVRVKTGFVYEEINKAFIIGQLAEKLAKSPAKIVAAAPKEVIKTDTKVVVDDKIVATFKDVAVYDANGKKQKPQGFGIQTGYFVEANRAVTEAKTLEAMKIGKVYIQTIETDGKKKYAVLVGEFKTKEETKELTKQLVEKKYSPFVKKH